MKTKIKIYVGVVLLLTISFLRIQVSKQNEVSLINVEALATGETGSACFYTGSVDCPYSGVKVYRVG